MSDTELGSSFNDTLNDTLNDTVEDAELEAIKVCILILNISIPIITKLNFGTLNHLVLIMSELDLSIPPP